jgi:hypothetical protein
MERWQEGYLPSLPTYHLASMFNAQCPLLNTPYSILHRTITQPVLHMLFVLGAYTAHL